MLGCLVPYDIITAPTQPGKQIGGRTAQSFDRRKMPTVIVVRAANPSFR